MNDSCIDGFVLLYFSLLSDVPFWTDIEWLGNIFIQEKIVKIV